MTQSHLDFKHNATLFDFTHACFELHILTPYEWTQIYIKLMEQKLDHIQKTLFIGKST